MISISPNEETIFTAVATFLRSVAPTGVEAIEGEANRVSEPSAKTFMVMWPLMRPRLATNVDSFIDTAFTASIAGTVMTVTEILIGTIASGATLFGVGVTAGTLIGTQISGSPGGIGTYNVSPGQTLSSRKMACGQLSVMQETEITMQVDVHAADLYVASDLAGAVATLWRDAYAVELIAGISPQIAPLYCDDPRQMPFLNGEQQFEIKWTVDLHLQVNQSFSGIPLQFFDATDLELINVDVEYPPT